LRRKILFVPALLIIASALAAGCGPAKKSDSGQTVPKGEVEKVELVYFHPRIRCLSCNNVEKYAREVAEDDFSPEMRSGKLAYRSLQIEDPKNRELVDELEVVGSSLYLVVEGAGKTAHREIKDVWFYWDKPAECKKIISDELSKYL